MTIASTSRTTTDAAKDIFPMQRHEAAGADAVMNPTPLTQQESYADECIARWGLLQTYGKALIQAEANQESVGMQTLPERLAALLVTWSNRQPRTLTGLNYQMLADELGTYRETVAAILRAFVRRGFVRITYQRVQVVDVDALIELSDSLSG